MFVAAPLLASFLTPFFGARLRYVSAALHPGLLAAALFLNAPVTERIAFDSPLAITFVLDDASHLFVLLFTLVMSLFALYRLNRPEDKALFVATNMLSAGVMGLVLSRDIFNLYIFFEIAAISAYVLTSLRQDARAYGGAIRYMIIGGAASLFLLLGIMLIYLSVGALDLVTIAERFNAVDPSMQRLILLCLFIGFGIKAELFPLNFWVADVYQAAQPEVSGLFSALLSKSYLFVFFHLAYLLQVGPARMEFVALLAATGFVVAEFSALRSRELKRVFAYSTLGQIGIISLALSYATQPLVAAALFLIVTHALAKLMLFFALDLLERRFGNTETALFGRFESLFLMTLFGVGFLSVLGIPPFAGFIAKLGLLKALAVEQAYGMIALILTVSLVEAAYLFRLLCDSRRDGTAEVIVIAWPHKMLLGAMMALLLALGVMPEILIEGCQRAAEAMLGGADVSF